MLPYTGEPLCAELLHVCRSICLGLMRGGVGALDALEREAYRLRATNDVPHLVGGQGTEESLQL